MVIAAIACAIAGVAGFWALKDAAPGQSAAQKDEATVAGTAPSASPGDAPSPAMAKPRTLPPTASDQTWPSEDAPLVDILGDLEARSANGDQRAACRLALEVHSCRDARKTDITSIEHSVVRVLTASKLQGQELAAVVRHHETQIQRFKERERHCAGVPDEVLDRWMHYDLQAALLGDLDAQERYVRASGLTVSDLMRDPRIAEDYRKYAMGFIRQRFEAGDPSAANFLAAAVHDDQGNFAFSGLATEDYIHPQVAHALMHILEPGRDQYKEPVAPEHRATAEMLYRRYFAGKPPERFREPRVGLPTTCE